ncbi:MAG: M20 family metallopeptidase [Lachnospiraceae bacterium]
MKAEELLKEAADLQPQLQEIRRNLHKHPELGFDLVYTKAFVREKLEEMGYKPQDCGKSGIIALAGGKRPGKVIMLRADMDALPICEEADIEYCSEIEGRMHGCGHDMHTAMLLGAAKLLKEHEEELEGTVKLEFQPAEEIFQGSVDMLKNGVLDNPKVDAAFMIHVLAGMPIPSGSLLIPGGGVNMASCEQYKITVKGKGGHGSMPHVAIDPLTAAAHIHLALQEINSRELDPSEYGVFTTCRIEAGRTSNVIPDSATMWGTIRTADLENQVGEQIKTRISEISKGVGTALRCEVMTEFYDYCPCMIINPQLSDAAQKYMTELFGKGALNMSSITGGKAGGGSEDFAFVSHQVPTIGLFLVAGNSNEGYEYSQHHPKVRFDDSVLYCGSAAYTYMAMRWLEENINS